MDYRVMVKADIGRVIPLYMEYDNTKEDGCWTYETAFRRIHQVWSREGAYCLLLEENGAPIGFAMGYFEQFDDISACDLVGIVVDGRRQGHPGARLMGELERRIKEPGRRWSSSWRSTMKGTNGFTADWAIRMREISRSKASGCEGFAAGT